MDIVLQSVSKRYGHQTVLNHFSCRIPAGTACAVMAPSGRGKTTLLNLILGLEKPNEGTITGVPKRKSALFQEDRLCPSISVMQNIRMAVPNCNEEKAMNILRALGLSDSADKPASALSGGMARRAALARALLYEGDMLTLDEPFSGLDEDNRLLAAQVITNHRNGRTLILVTHRPEDLELLGIEQVINL